MGERTRGARRLDYYCHPRGCPYLVTERYRNNPPERQTAMRTCSHVARRYCNVDGEVVGYQAECRIRPDDERLPYTEDGGHVWVNP